MYHWLDYCITELVQIGKVKGMRLSAVGCVWFVGYNILSHIRAKVGSRTWVELISDLLPKVDSCIYMKEQCASVHRCYISLCYVTLSVIDHCWQWAHALRCRNQDCNLVPRQLSLDHLWSTVDAQQLVVKALLRYTRTSNESEAICPSVWLDRLRRSNCFCDAYIVEMLPY